MQSYTCRRDFIIILLRVDYRLQWHCRTCVCLSATSHIGATSSYNSVKTLNVYYQAKTK